ncbi:MAG: HlyD family type I secretion periplasmic adaptor subunit [Rhodobacteraceae bacterium]|nr:HlyD family type I secretion periplasmic adaptor subunit [Paracoccaceae bacterium]
MTEQLWPARRYIVFGLLALVILIGGLGTWAVGTNIAGAVIAPGQIEVDQNRQVVQHPDGGVVSEILISDGDEVEVGDILLRLDPIALQSELTIVEGQLYELMARRGRLEAERDASETLTFEPELLEQAEISEDVKGLVDGQSRLFEARNTSNAGEIELLSKRRAQIEIQIEGLKDQQDSIRLQSELITQEWQDQKSLQERGLAQKSRVLALEREAADLKGSLGKLIADEAQAEDRITETELQILQLKSRLREEAITQLRDLQYHELELLERRRALREQLNRLDLRAPVSGIVYGLQFRTPRSVIRPADPVLYLVPQDRPLVIAARVQPIDVDQIFLGQSVALRFSALDQRLTPELYGEVTLVSADAIVDEQVGVSYYRTEIFLQEGETGKLPEGTVLIPGMPVEAFIRTHYRSPLAYLMKPLTDYFTRAFRET